VPLLEIVLGRTSDGWILHRTAADHVALSVVEGPFPCIVPAVWSKRRGFLLLRGWVKNDLVNRLEFSYEGSFA